MLLIASRRSAAVLGIASLGIFMVFLDTQVLFVAFGDIRASFPDVSIASLSWVLSGYTLVFAAALVPAGRLADRIGRKRIFLGALGFFTATSALCALGPTPGALMVDAWGWRSVFLLNIPFGIVTALAGRAVLEESKEADAGPFPDLAGSAIIAAGVAAISLALVQ